MLLIFSISKPFFEHLAKTQRNARKSGALLRRTFGEEKDGAD
jgi:hypothetical protein